ncbi:MAG: hypothetical protein OXN89_02805 [Bryobacterales bacterium]|nr:hypothetical protein [Bryobacterales bacterium]
MNPDRLAKIVLAFSAIEALAQDEDWGPEQRNFIEKLATEVKKKASGDGERSAGGDAIRRLSRTELRQGVRRVLSRNALGHLQDEWDRLYDRRSDVFHGSEPLTKQEGNTLAADAVTLWCRIILAIFQQSGITLPSIASTHFGTI